MNADNEITAVLAAIRDPDEVGLRELLEPEPVLISFQVDRAAWDRLGERARRILMDEMPEWITEFMSASLHYGDGNADELGEQGQFADIYRKVGPLRRALWEGQELTREPVERILRDLIGHCFLTLEMRRRAARP